MAKEPQFAKIRFAIEAGLVKLQKWYKAVDNCEMYFICLGVLRVCCLSSTIFTNNYQLLIQHIRLNIPNRTGTTVVIKRV